MLPALYSPPEPASPVLRLGADGLMWPPSVPDCTLFGRIKGDFLQRCCCSFIISGNEHVSPLQPRLVRGWGRRADHLQADGERCRHTVPKRCFCPDPAGKEDGHTQLVHCSICDKGRSPSPRLMCRSHQALLPSSNPAI